MAIDPDETSESPLPPPAFDTLLRYATAPRARVEMAGLTHRGLVRDQNEDCYLFLEGHRALNVLGTNLPESAMPVHYTESSFGMLVADGVGGMSGGEVASRLAVQALMALVLSTPDWIMLTGKEQNRIIIERMHERYRDVDSIIREEAMANPELTGMGTTMTVAHSIGANLFVGHVGDSRAYLFRSGQLNKLTRDHTMAQALADKDLIPAHEVATHHFRHMLTRFMGGGRPVMAEVLSATLQHGDQILLCSDGLTDMVSEAAVAEMLSSAPTAQATCQSLIDAALKAGGKDNVTAVVARYQLPKTS